MTKRIWICRHDAEFDLRSAFINPFKNSGCDMDDDQLCFMDNKVDVSKRKPCDAISCRVIPESDIEKAWRALEVIKMHRDTLDLTHFYNDIESILKGE